MESIYLISDFSDKIKRLAESLKLPAQNIISYQYKENESGYHTWLNDEFKAKEIDKIIIPVSISNDDTINTIGLLLGLHIRLNYELSLEKRLIPIIFLLNFTVENLIKVNFFDSDNNPQNLIFTKGIYFSSFVIEDIQKTIKSSTKCVEADYHKCVLSKLNIVRKGTFRKETYGGHDIANAWGCFKVAQVIGVDSKIYQLDSIAKHLKKLYAKYLICKNETFSTEKRIDLNPIKCNRKNILFIDDKSDEGWAELMKNLFRKAGDNFKYVDSSKYKADDVHKSFKNFDDFITECRSHIGKEWDLIIIDLRLNPEKEDIDNEMIPPTEFSGYKLIDEFLNENEGYQIIVSTASNKIWNINAALERGASSYYVKESPEFNYSISETNKHYENFKQNVQKCFKRKYLYNVWKCINKIKKHLNNNPLKKYFPNNFKILKALQYQNLILVEVDSSFEMLKTNNENKLNIVMISIFKILESLSEIFIEKDGTNGKLQFWDGKEVMFCKYLDKKYDLKPKTSEIKKYAYESTENKVHSILFQKLDIEDLNIHQVVHNISQYRNDYIHPENRFKLPKLISNDIENWFTKLEKILIKL